jgi:hypothetical protein
MTTDDVMWAVGLAASVAAVGSLVWRNRRRRARTEAEFEWDVSRLERTMTGSTPKDWLRSNRWFDLWTPVDAFDEDEPPDETRASGPDEGG